MKKLISLLLILASVLCRAAEIIVNPNPLGLAFSTSVGSTVTPPIFNPPDWAPYVVKTFATARPGDVVVIPTPPVGVQYHFLTTAILQGTSSLSSFLRVGLKFDGENNSLVSNHAGPMFHFFGLNSADIHLNGVELDVSGSQVLQIDGASTGCFGISGQMEVKSGAKNCTLIQIGSDKSNDVSVIDIHNCYLSTGSAVGSTTPQILDACHADGNVGIRLSGGNTLAITIRNSNFVGFDQAITQMGYLGANSGGSGLVLQSVYGSWNNLFLATDGYYDTSWIGGRLEHGRTIWLSGAAGSAQSGVGHVTMRDVLLDDYIGGAAGCDSKALFQIDGCQDVLLDGVTNFSGSCTVDPAQWISIRSLGMVTLNVSRSLGSASTVKAIEGGINAAAVSQ